MNTPITLTSILTIFGILVAIVGGVTAIIALVKWINNIHDRVQKWDEYDMKIANVEKSMSDLHTDIDGKLQQIRAEQYVLTDCMVAVLDGLQQLGCNGKVTQAKNNLANYMNEKAHEMKKE